MLKALWDMGLYPRERKTYPSELLAPGEVFGVGLKNPIGISAGLDKHAEIPDLLFELGAAVVEVGGCTPLPQEGNTRPRVFRIPVLDGMVNRYGLNSRGADLMAISLRGRVRKFARSNGFTELEVLDGEAGVPPGSLVPGKLLAVQIAKNKKTDEKDLRAVVRDYVYCVRRLAPYADVIVVNVSSPNTPGLRNLQAVEPLSRILAAVVREARQTERKRSSPPAVMVKVSPDEDSDSQVEGIIHAIWASGVDGVIVGNTTKRRSGIACPEIKLTHKEQLNLAETGGYSGPQMFERTLELVKRYRKGLDEVGFSIASLDSSSSSRLPSPVSPSDDSKRQEGQYNDAVNSDSTAVTTKAEQEDHDNGQKKQKVIFATGGIVNGTQARKVLDAGAKVAMIYTGMVYGGLGTVTRIKTEMLEEAIATSSGKDFVSGGK